MPNRPKTYKGRIRIVCEAKSGLCGKKIGKDVLPSCAGCEFARIEIIGLKDELKYRINLTIQQAFTPAEIEEIKELTDGL